MLEKDLRPIKEGSYFILGDKPEASYDGRFMGVIPQESIFGKVLEVLASFEGDFNKQENPRQDRFGILVRAYR